MPESLPKNGTEVPIVRFLEELGVTEGHFSVDDIFNFLYAPAGFLAAVSLAERIAEVERQEKTLSIVLPRDMAA